MFQDKMWTKMPKWKHFWNIISLEISMFMFSLLRLFDRIIDVYIIDGVEGLG